MRRISTIMINNSPLEKPIASSKNYLKLYLFNRDDLSIKICK